MAFHIRQSTTIDIGDIDRRLGPIHRDYKRIEVASGDESRNKLNKSNGGQI